MNLGFRAPCLWERRQGPPHPTPPPFWRAIRLSRETAVVAQRVPCEHCCLRASVYPLSRSHPPPTPQEELESYPLSAIVRCDAVMPPGRSRSLLLLVCQEPERAQPDVHFFQGLRLGVSWGWVEGAPGAGKGPGWAKAGSGQPRGGAWKGIGKEGGPLFFLSF